MQLKPLLGLLWVLSSSIARAAHAESEVYIFRELGTAGSQGLSGIELVCFNPSKLKQFCRLSKTLDGKTLEFKNLKPQLADQIFKNFISALGNSEKSNSDKNLSPSLKPSSAPPSKMTWSLSYSGIQKNGEIPSEVRKVERTHLAVMKLEAELTQSLL